MALSEHVNLTITLDSVGLTRPGFGTPLILSAGAVVNAWPADEFVRFYFSLAEVIEDGHAEDSPEALAAAAVFAQRPAPTQLAIGRGTHVPTQRYSLEARTISDSTAYKIRVTGEGVTETETDYVSDASATKAEIHYNTVTDLNAVVGKNYTATYLPLVFADATFTADNATNRLTVTGHGLTTGDGPLQASNSGGALPTGISALTDYWVIVVDANTIQIATSLANAIAGTAVDFSTNGTGTHTLSDTASTVTPAGAITVTATNPGDWFSLECLVPARWNVSQTHADPGVAADLTAIIVSQPAWYGLITLYNSDAYVKAAAAFIESDARRLYFAAMSESIAANVASDGTQGTLDDLSTLEYRRTAGMYHPAPDRFLDAALMGRYFSTDPGQAKPAYMNLAGVGATTLTGTERTNLNDRNASYYKEEANRGMFWKGKVAAGEWIDVIRDLDWVFSEIQIDCLEALAAGPPPFTDPGIAVVVNAIRGVLQRAVKARVFSGDLDDEPTVTAPRARDVSSANRANRHLPDVRWRARMAGAIYTTDVTGVVTQ